MDKVSNEEMEALVREARKLPAVSRESAECYQNRTPLLVKRVNHLMVSRGDLEGLIGNNNLGVMFDNHKHHAAFLTAVFLLGRHEILANHLPWIYRTYRARGFSLAYFPAQLDAWMQAVRENLPESHAGEILGVYQWIKTSHPVVVDTMGRNEPARENHEDPVYSKRRIDFRDNALRGEHRNCMRIATLTIGEPGGVSALYKRIIQPAMEEIGHIWALGEISIAEEHLASSVVGRVMTHVSMQGQDPKPPKGRVLVTTPPGEKHELGAWMVADLLERDGWEAHYVGAAPDAEAVVRNIGEWHPGLLAFSVTVAFNLPSLQEVIGAVRRTFGENAPKILVGGEAFHGSGDLWSELGADGWAKTPEQALELTDSWGMSCQ